MSPGAHPQLSAVFERAIDVPIAERAAFLDDACTGDLALRREVESLLEAHDSAAGYFEQLAQRLVAPALANSQSDAPLNLVAALESGLSGSYRIERELGGGGMSRVFVAEEIALRRRVVIKTLPPETGATVNAERFRREIAVAAQLQHPHIVPLLTASASGLVLFYTMPYIAGESLRDRLAAGGALAVDDALRVWRDMLDALAHAHANGVVHRDIKPANILLSGRNAMVADFGIARAMEAAAEPTGAASASATGPIGTPAYMAPEQAAGAPLDNRADLYAAGLVMYEMLAGRPPFIAGSAAEYLEAQRSSEPEPLRRSDIPARVAELVMLCLAKAPADRPASAEAIIAALDAITVAAPRAHGRRRLAFALATVVVAAVGFGAWAASRPPSVRPRHVPPDTAMRLYQRGRAEHDRRTIEGAIEAMNLFRRAIAIDSEFSEAWAGVARTAQFATNRGWTLPGRSIDSLLPLAVRASRRAVELDSSSAEAWTVAGKVAGAVDLEDRGAAFYALQRAVALHPSSADAWFELGLAHEESLHPADAERAWLRSASLSPTNFEVRAFLAWHYLWNDQYETGMRWADSAIAISPTYFLARDAAAYLAVALHQPEIAVRHVAAVQRTQGHEPSVAPSIMSLVAASQHRVARARRYALAAESTLADTRHPSKHEATYLGAAWAAAGDTARAIRWLSAYAPRGDLHFQLHVKRDPALRWFANKEYVAAR